MRLLVAVSLMLAYGMRSVDSALTIEQGGMTTNEREFCIGDQLTFRCTSRESAYSWIVTGFLNGTIGNGRVLTGANEMDGEFMLSASGINNDRMSTLQVTVFEGLVGERTVTCREGGTTDGGQSVNITVLDYPPAPTISEVTSTTNPPSFNMTIQPPSARTMCVGGQYQLTIRSSSPDSSEQSVTRVNVSVADPPVTISYAVNSAVVPNFNVCTYNYSFEIAVAVNPMTTNQQDGEFDYGVNGYFSPEVMSSSSVSVTSNTSLVECSDVAVLVIDRVRDDDMSDATSMTTVIGDGVTVSFTGTTFQYTCTPHIVLPSGRRLSFDGFNCSTSATTIPPTFTTIVTEPSSSGGSNTALIVGITVGVIGGIVLAAIIAVLIFCCCCCHKKGKNNGGVERMEEVPLEGKPQDPPSVYQDPNSIVRKPAPDSSTDVYTVPQKKQKKGSKKVEPAPAPVEEEKMLGTVYAEVDLKNAKKPPPPRSRPAPGPPNTIVPQPDTGNVVYSTVQMQ